MIPAHIVWGAPNWIVPAAALAGAALVLLIWSYRRSRSAAAVRWCAGLVKAVGLVLLLLCLLEPLWSGTRARPGANQFAVVVDNSQSLQLTDAGQTRSRGELLQDRLADDASWQIRLAQDFDVRRYLCDARLRSVNTFDNLPFDGAASLLTGSLQTLAERFRGRPLAGILLLTDGNATDLADWLPAPGALPPVYPVIVGSDRPARDISISRVTVSQTNFEAAPVTLHAEITSSGYPRQTLIAELLDPSGAVLQKQSVPTTDERQPAVCRFAFRPPEAGICFYRLRVAAEADLAPAARQSGGEATLANNTRLLMVDRGGGPYRVLYVCGRPNWEYKYLRRAVEEDPEIQLVGLVRIARREPKFNFLSRRDEDTNPLFRGFEGESEDAERYDQPVLLRLGTRDEHELRDGFPKSDEELFAYHAVILDDVEAEFFTHEQMLLLQRFVSHRGGGVMMLGGAESFAGGEYHRTPIGDMLPVYLDRVPPLAPADNPRFRLELTREGWLQSWVRLRETESAEQQRLDEMPAFRSANRVRGIKPGAVVLAHVVGADGVKLPALVSQRFGKGRAAALPVADWWRWSLRRPEGGSPDGLIAWRQTVRWLVADVPGRVQVDAERRPREPGNPVHLNVSVRDEEFAPLDNAAVAVKISAPSGEELELNAEPVSEKSGQYQVTYVPREPGGYRATVAVTAADGSQVGQHEAGWAAEPAAEEFSQLRPNRRWLQALAEQTGGQVIQPGALARLVADLPNRKVPIREAWIYPLWHRPAIFLMALVCLLTEWGLRRWNGLP